MRCLRTLGVLSLTLSLVWSMTLETTSPRYLQDSRSTKLGLGDKQFSRSVDSSAPPFSSVATNVTNYVNDSLNLTVNRRYVNSDTSLALSNNSNSSLRVEPKETEESRKIKTHTKNLIRTPIKKQITKTNGGSKTKYTSSTKATTKTPPVNVKKKLSTMAPITIKLTKRTTKKPNVSTPKSYNVAKSTSKPPSKIKPTTSTPKRKPTRKTIITKLKDSVTTAADIKQNWYEEGVPYPNPMPQITSSSPPFSISDSSLPTYSSSTIENIYLDALDQGVESISPEIYSNSPSEPLQGVPSVLPQSPAEDLESVAVPAADNPISTFNLDMLPTADLTRDPSGSGCPTVHIASAVLSPLQRQGCSDLNLVLNTHYHQNQDTRNPAISTYDASAPGAVEAVEDPIVDDGLANAGATGGGVASDAATYTGGGAPGGGSSGGASGGSGGSGGDGGGNGGFKLPDLKPVFEALGYLMRGLWWLLQKLMNPWLYIVPIVLFFKLGFLGIITLFPWWIPFVFLYFSVRTDEPKNTVSHVKHHHKPVVVKHHDGLYWDQHTKSWRDVTDHHGYRRRRSGEDAEDMIDDDIIRSTPQPTDRTVENAHTRKPQETNTTTVTLWDVRSPPKVQNQIKEKLSSKYSIEQSHAGVAIPIDADVEVLEESTKKMNFYKLERPTTASNAGLSTWILLSGQTSVTSPKPTTTKKSSVKPIIMKDEKNNETLMLSDKPIKMVKPAFKPRSTTMKPSNVTKTTTVRVNTFSPSSKAPTRKPTKLTKVKASLLQNVANSKLNSTLKGSVTANRTTTTIKPTTELTNVTTTGDLSTLAAEAKEGDQELPTANEKKKKTQKRKKNKNRRRKPDKASKEGDNKLKEAESASTQLYSYFRSEIIPVTVGVSLVGLLVTAGLASYYLQPFAALRRSDPIDRKDTEGSYYYREDYSNAMPEEEAIGKVIAGMPETTLQGNYKQPTSRNTYPQNARYRHVDRRSQIYMNPYGSVEDVQLSDRTPTSYDKESGNDKKQYVVGNVPKETVEEATPAVVPEHGPRNLKEEERKFVVGNIPKEFFSVRASPRDLKVRRRRQTFTNDLENEISPEENEIDTGNYLKTTTATIDTTITPETLENNDTDGATTQEVATKDTTPHNVFNPIERPNTLFELIADLFKLKVRLGLELLQNVTNSVSNYVSRVHSKLDEHYRKATRGNAGNGTRFGR